MKFGIEFVPNEPIPKIASYAKAAEEQGFEYVWVTDHYNNRELYAALSVIALATDKIRIGAGVTNPYTRSSAVTASGIASIHELSGGRAIIGIGPGDKLTFESLGIAADKPLGAVKETVLVLRELLCGGKVSFAGENIQLKNAKIDFADPKKAATTTKIPIYVGAQGPKMLEMAGAVADGVLINASHPDDFKAAAVLIQKGAGSAGRKVGAGTDDGIDIDIAAYTCFSIDEDAQKAYSAAKPVVAFIVAGAADVLLQRHGISAEDKKEIADAVSKGNFKDLSALVTDKMVDRFAVAGDFDACVQKAKALEKAGVTQIVAGSPLGPNKEKSIKMIGKIIEAF
jgi:5,10-methylenetetrahydromethanopterin reductase